MNVKIESSWQQRLQEEFDKPYFEKLVNFVKNEYGKAHIPVSYTHLTLPTTSRV